MGELVAWGLGLAFGYTVRNMLTSWWRDLLAVIVVLALGTMITLSSGEMMSEPWLVVIDIGQVGVAALLGCYVLPRVLRWLRRVVGTAIS